MKKLLLLNLVIIAIVTTAPASPVSFFPATDPRIRYMGRIDFSDPALPRFWQPGVSITISFKGTRCAIILQDEVLWGQSHNYLELILDEKPVRKKMNASRDTIWAGEELPDGVHTLEVVKNTEANTGYMELVGFLCTSLLELPAPPGRKIEFYGNSITCGTGSDISAIPCGKGRWEDQHNAYFSYAAITARTLHASYHLSAVSGIGLTRSCCNMDIVMPGVYDKVSMRNDTINWDFSRWQPDIIGICLGQNDGIMDSAVFVQHYIDFIKSLRRHNPGATFICLTSPMADRTLADWMRKMIEAVKHESGRQGEHRVLTYAFSKQYHNGCDNHPDMQEHTEIAKELSDFIKKQLNW